MEQAELKEFNESINKTFVAFQERNDKVVAEMEKRNGEATAESLALMEKTNTELTELRQACKDLEVKMNRPNFTPEDERSAEDQLVHRAYDKMLRGGLETKDGIESPFALEPEEMRALTSASDGTGGFLVPVDYEGGIIMNAYNVAEIRPLAQVGTTGRDVVQMGALSKPSVAWGPRAAAAISAQDLTAGTRVITIYPLTALTLVAIDTLDDAEANLEQELNDAFSRATSEAQDDAFAVGAGDDSPRGIVSNTDVQGKYKASGVSDALSDSAHNGHDALIDVLYALKKTYRRNATWLFNSSTEAEIRKLKDGEGRYIWQPGAQAGAPSELLGRPIANPEGMPDIGAGTYPIVAGDIRSGYKIRDRKGMTIQRLVEVYAVYRQVGFLISSRVGGDVTLAEAFVPMKIAAS